jgi:hypothetical protein
MCEFSQKFKTFCLNSRATKFYPNLLASHLKLRIKLKHIKIIFKLWYKCELDFLDLIWCSMVWSLNLKIIQIQTIMKSVFKTICQS